MTVIVQQGNTAAIKLKFLNGDGSVAAAPTSGGAITRNRAIANGNFGLVALDADQQTVHYKAIDLGTDTLTYTGPTGSAITATESVQIVATTAVSAAFDESTYVTPDPNPPASSSYS